MEGWRGVFQRRIAQLSDVKNASKTPNSPRWANKILKPPRICQVRKSKKLFSMYGAFGGRGCIIPDVVHVDERRVDIYLVPLRAMHEMYGIPLPGGYEAYLKDAHPEFYVRGRNG